MDGIVVSNHTLKSRLMMSLYMVVHSVKVSPEQFTSVMESEEMPEFAKAMFSGGTPAKCLKSWNPIPYGKTDSFVCLWEADRASDIEATLGPDMLQMITCEPMQVDEIDWAEVAQSAK